LSDAPGCIGQHGAPIPPNGPCASCREQKICLDVSKRFVPREVLTEILTKVERLEELLEATQG
jgi:hypothetical protein